MEALKRHWRRGAVDVREQPVDPIALVDWADKEVRRKRRGGEGYDQSWIVFDAEACPDPSVIAQVRARAREAGIHLAMSNPCFEVWLLLHLRYTHAPMVDAEEAIRRLRADLPQHAKDRRGAENCMAALVDEVETALENATRLRRYHEDSMPQGIPNPTTDVDRLVEAIRPVRDGGP